MLALLFRYLYFRHFFRFKSRVRLLAWQARQRNSLLQFLEKNSPYYQKHGAQEASLTNRKIYDENFDEINTVGMKKKEAMEFCLLAEETKGHNSPFKGMTVGLSSGTSNRRGLFVVTQKERQNYSAQFLAKLLPGSILSKHRIAYFIRADSALYSTSKSSRIRFRYYDLKVDLNAQFADLLTYSPTLLFAPPSVLLRLAEFRKSTASLAELQCLFTGAEVLDPVDACRISAVFRVPLRSIYQCTEGFFAASCPQGGIHLNEDLILFEKEYLDPERKRFCPIITDLRRKAQPYLRYRMNDVLLEAEAPCACGSVLQTIAAITGREEDLIRLNGKNVLFHDELTAIFLKYRDEFLEYSLVQTGINELTLSLREEKAGARERIETEILDLVASKSFPLPVMKKGMYEAPLAWVKLRRIRNQATIPFDVLS